jgi:peptide/nickel transport system ATP-binding protein
MSKMTPLLEIKNLHVHFKTYEGELKVLNGVDMTIGEGEKLGLVGETGCGKTTTMKSVLRILPIPPAKISAGEIFYQGRDILKMKSNEVRSFIKGGITAIFQDPMAALNPVFTIGYQLQDIIKQSLKAQGQKRLSKEEVRSRAVAVLRETDMPDPERILRSYSIQLSGGMRQRVCISEALSTVAKLLIADEPTTNLDVTIQDQILRRLDKLVLTRKTSILFITHSLGVIKNLMERVCIMYAGNIVEAATTEDVFADPSHPYTRALLSTVPKLTGQGVSEGIQGRIPDYLNPPEGCRFHPRCNKAMPICKKESPPFFNVGNSHKVACFLYS